MSIPVIVIGFASFGAAIEYCQDTKQFCWSVTACGWSKAGVLKGDK